MPSSTRTDTQLVALAAAAHDAGGLIALPDHLKGAAVLAFGRKLVSLGLAAERAAARGQTPWRRDSDSGDVSVLAITPAGLAALGIDEAEGAADFGMGVDKLFPLAAPRQTDATTVTGLPETSSSAAPPASAPRVVSKQAQLFALISAPGGSSMDELVAALEWLPHTTRAALTGLRKNGYVIERERSAAYDDGPAVTRYRIVAAAGAGAVDAAAEAEATASADEVQ